jgi:hypothetical protein
LRCPESSREGAAVATFSHFFVAHPPRGEVLTTPGGWPTIIGCEVRRVRLADVFRDGFAGRLRNVRGSLHSILRWSRHPCS